MPGSRKKRQGTPSWTLSRCQQFPPPCGMSEIESGSLGFSIPQKMAQVHVHNSTRGKSALSADNLQCPSSLACLRSCLNVPLSSPLHVKAKKAFGLTTTITGDPRAFFDLPTKEGAFLQRYPRLHLYFTLNPTLPPRQYLQRAQLPSGKNQSPFLYWLSLLLRESSTYQKRRQVTSMVETSL